MRSIGFSTGALALGDFDKGLALLADRDTSVIELSALREDELPSLMGALDRLHLGGYRYVSVHAPSRLRTMKEAVVADMLRACIDRQWHVVLHPDAIGDHGCWRDFGPWLCIENMDKRKEAGRTAIELRRHFRGYRRHRCVSTGARPPSGSDAWNAREITTSTAKDRPASPQRADVKSPHEPLTWRPCGYPRLRIASGRPVFSNRWCSQTGSTPSWIWRSMLRQERT